MKRFGLGEYSMAVSATLHCLTGCATGEITGMLIGTALGWSKHSTIFLSIGLAFLFGYFLTTRSLQKHGLNFKQAFRLALGVDTLSILTMEVIDNLIMYFFPGAMDAGLISTTFWLALMISLFVAFWVTVPVNKLLMEKGKGHALVHKYHH